MTPQMKRRAWTMELLPNKRTVIDQFIESRRRECYNELAKTLPERTERAKAEAKERWEQNIKPLTEGKKCSTSRNSKKSLQD